MLSNNIPVYNITLYLLTNVQIITKANHKRQQGRLLLLSFEIKK